MFVHTDSTAAIGIVHRCGLGRTLHIEVQYLWVHDNVNRKTISAEKVGSNENPADMFTKGSKRETIEEHMRFTGGQVHQGKSKTALSIRAISRNNMMRFMRPNLLQKGGDK